MIEVLNFLLLGPIPSDIGLGYRVKSTTSVFEYYFIKTDDAYIFSAPVGPIVELNPCELENLLICYSGAFNFSVPNSSTPVDAQWSVHDFHYVLLERADSYCGLEPSEDLIIHGQREGSEVEWVFRYSSVCGLIGYTWANPDGGFEAYSVENQGLFLVD